MRTIRTLLVACALALGGASASHVAAEPQAAAPGSASIARARKLFDEGLVHVKKKEWKEAEALFAEAWVLNPTYDVAANLGHVRDKLGKTREAAELLDAAVRSWPLSAKTRAQRELSVNRLAELRALLGTLAIEVNVSGASVSVNGRVIGTSPLGHEVFIEPGPATVEATLAGYTPVKQTLTAAKGERAGVRLALVPAAMASAASTTPTASASTTSTTRPAESANSAASVVPMTSSTAASPFGGARKEVLIAGGAVTLAAIATGVGLLVASEDKSAEAAGLRESLDAKYGAKPCAKSQAASECQAVVDALSSRVGLGNAGGSVLVGAGVVAGATLGYWLFMRQRPVEVTPVAAPGTAGLVVRGAW